MKAFVLGVALHDFPNCPVWVDTLNEGRKEVGLTRSSPIYRVSRDSSEVPFSPGAEHVWFGFTLNPYKAIALVRKHVPEVISRLYTSHGLASVIIFFQDDREIERVKTHIKEFLLADETWKIAGGAIADISFREAKKPVPINVELHLSEHGPEDYAIFRDLTTALHAVCPRLLSFGAEHNQMAASTITLAQQLSVNVLQLTGKISKEESTLRLTKIFKDDSALAKTMVQGVEQQRTNPQTLTIALHQFRDEAIQISAIFQSIFQQGVAPFAPLLNSSHQIGTFSLLGIGSVFGALLALYARVRSAFTAVQPDRIVAQDFPKWKAPPLPEANKYEAWRLALKEFSGPVSSPPAYPSEEGIFHLLYFSNRLGFRATKLSITAAFQSIMLGTMPSWNVSTIFHEFLHVHVKSLLAEVFPDEASFETAYPIYAARLNKPDAAKNLRDFVHALFLKTASDLYLETSESRSLKTPVAAHLEKDVLKRELLRLHDQIDELFVHVLDLNYFYQSDTQTYIRSIWSSWLTLPFIMDRLGEYALRTICAIAAIDDGQQLERFNRALATLRTELAALQQCEFVDKQLVGEVLSFLGDNENIRPIRMKFVFLGPLADVVAEFFVFPTLEPQLFREVSDELQKDETYSYGLKPGEYNGESIESPVKFIMDHLKHTLAGWAHLPNDEAEFQTLWSFQKIGSTLTEGKQ